MTREEKDKLLTLMGEERNSYAEHINREVDKLFGKIEGADFMLHRLLDHFHNDSYKPEESEETKNERL